MEWSEYLVAAVFGLVSLVCVLAVPVGLPGTWVMLALAVGLEVLDTSLLGTPELVTFGWPTLGIAGAIAVAGEVLEAGAGAAGTRLGGGTTRGMLGAILGGLLGAIVLTPIVPIPLVGTLIGAFLGTFAGAFYAEFTSPEAREASMPARAALGAALGRLAGTLGKLMLAIVIWVVLTWAAFSA
jgi:uncharacterized protein YqgC (DUF456 family)